MKIEPPQVDERGTPFGPSNATPSAISDTPKRSEPLIAAPSQAIRLVEDRWATVRHVVESIAIVAAGAWAFYTFFYQNDIKPAQDPPALHEVLRISRLGRDAKRDFIDASFGFQNVGKTEIDIAADAWNVWGIRYGTRARAQSVNMIPMTRFVVREYRDSVPILSEHLVARFVDLREAAQGGRPANIILEPGDETTLHDVLVLRRGAYDLLKTELVAVPVKTAEFGPHTGRRVRVAIVRQKDGSVFLEPHTEDAFEDDNLTYFALTP